MRTAAETYEVAARRLRRVLAGELHLPGEPGYDAPRRPLHDTHRPAAGDGRRGVRSRRRPGGGVAAREHGLPLAVQATGHGTHVPADGGILLKTVADGVGPGRPGPADRQGRPGRRAGATSSPQPRRSASRRCPARARRSASTGYTLGGGVGWLARAVRLRGRQRAPRRGRHRRRRARHGERRGAPRPVLGAARRRRQLRRGHLAGVPAVPGRAGSTPASPYFAIDRAAETLRATATGPPRPDELSTAVVLTRHARRRRCRSRRGRRVLAIKVMYAGPPSRPSAC